MEEIWIELERNKQKIRSLEHSVASIKEIQSQIETMNETLVMLTTELKHTNEHLIRQEQRIYEIERQPNIRLYQIITAIISAIAGGLISYIIANIFK